MASDRLCEIRTVLARLELCSSAATVSYNPDGRQSTENPGGKRPPGPVFTAADWYRRRLDLLERGRPLRVDGEHGGKVRDSYERLLGDARRELEQLTGRTDRAPEPVKALDTFVIAEQDAPGTPADKLADRLSVSPFQMKRWYAGWHLDPATGEALSGAKEDRAEDVQRLLSQGMGERQIALALGIARGTVRKALGKAA